MPGPLTQRAAPEPPRNFDEVNDRLAALEALARGESLLSLDAIPTRQLSELLEQTWRPDGQVLLGERTVAPQTLAKVPWAHMRDIGATGGAPGVWVLATWDTVVYDNYQMTGVPNRFVARIPGIYLVSMGVRTNTAVNGQTGVALSKNANSVPGANQFAEQVYPGQAGGVLDNAYTITAPILLQTNDYVESWFFSSSGTGTYGSLGPELVYNWFKMTWLGNYD